MTAHHKICPHEKRYETIHGHKYASTYKSLSYKNADAWKQNINMLNKTIDDEPVCVYYEF
jgi:hypothetical protein